MLSNVCVVIRSSNERTEAVCEYLVKQQVKENNVVTVHERPFSHALRRSLEIGIDAGLDWTLCVDADLLVAQDAIGQLIEELSSYPETVLGGHGIILDKFYGGTKHAGPHLYRTSLLDKMLQAIPDASVDLRPETYAKSVVSARGHSWIQLRHIAAIHDFEQYYSDIYRTMIVRANKSREAIPTLLRRAETLAANDTDFRVGMWALRVGSAWQHREILLDSEQWREEAALLLTAHGIAEKEPLSINNGRELPQTEVRAFLRTRYVHKLKAYPGHLIRRFVHATMIEDNSPN